MVKRMCWMLASVLLPLLLLGGIGQVEGMMGETAVVATPNIVINEIHADPDSAAGDANGDGTISSTQDEFIEIVNAGGALIDLSGWSVWDEVGKKYTFPTGTLVPDGCAVVVFGGGTPIGDFGGSIVQTAGSLGLNNGGDTVMLKLPDGTTAVISYTYGSEGGDNQSLTRNPDITGTVPLVKHSIVANASGALFSPGTRTGGSSFASCEPPALADIRLEKSGPGFVQAGELLIYSIKIENSGSAAATNVVVTDTLPDGVDYISDDSGSLPTQPNSQTLVWQMGTVPTQTTEIFNLTVRVNIDVNGWLTNSISGTTSAEEISLDNNVSQASTYVGTNSVLLDAVLYDGWAANDIDEAVSLRNIGSSTVNLTGWKLNGKLLPANITLPPGESIWLTKNATAFTQQFGFAPDGVLPLWPGLTNTGDEVLLANDQAQIVDVLVYEDGNTGQAGWVGTAVQPFTVAGQDGQILYRQRSQTTGQIEPDTNTAADWAQSLTDVINGRKVRYPGWDLDEFFFTTQVTETAVLTIAIAPDNAYEAITQQIQSAQTSLQAEVLSFENTAIADAFIQAATRGVSVTLLLEGGPVGGVTDQEHYLCQQLMAAGGLCAFMINDSTTNIFDRYDYLHAKFVLIDGERVIVSSQNLSPDSLPSDDKSDGTLGRRGVILITDAAQVVAHIQTVFERDYDFAHQDIVTGISHLAPLPIGFVPITETGGTTYTVRYPHPISFSSVFPFEIVQSPENSLRDVDGLLGLVNRAGEGDVVLVQQLYEQPFWGSNSVDDPNPRLEAYINAARRGAQVRILLDEFFDIATDSTSNAVTCVTVREIAKQEHLRLECAVANPTGLGIHNKMVLVQVAGKGYIHVGSINGSESSSKANRELALQVQSNEAYTYLAAMFDHDWPYRVHLPLISNNVYGPANHLLISEVQYNPPGLDDAEFVELVNPTSLAINISAYSLGDAVNRVDFEDIRRFPANTILPSQQTLVIATSAAAFFAEFNVYPDYEILETVTAVPNLIDDPAWGDPATFFQLGNSGDEIILRGINDHVIDVVSYGTGNYPGAIPCPSVTILGAVLERFPYWQDTNECAADFREWPYPSPGTVPN